MATVPVVRLAHLSAAEIRAYVLADNKLALEAGWDNEMLAIEHQGLIDLGFDIELTGFDTGEIDVSLDDAAEAGGTNLNDDDAVSESDGRPVVTRVGDLWNCGKQLLLCGDSRETSSYDVLMGGAKAEFVFADPPYNVRIGGHVSGLGQTRHREFAMAAGELSPREFTGFLTTNFRRLDENSTDGSVHEICMDWRHVGEMLEAGNAVHAELKNICVWAKTNAGMGSFYRSQHELVFVWKKGTAPHINNIQLGVHGRSRSNRAALRCCQQ
jgi:hypothetical protein